MNRILKQYMLAIPPWIILGALAFLVPIFLFWTLHNLNKQKEDMIMLLAEKGAALIRSFEAGTRTGMMGMMGRGAGDFRLQHLLSETAQQTDILYLVVTNDRGLILAHNDPTRVGDTHGTELDLQRVSTLEAVEWRQVPDLKGAKVFEVFRRFSPTQAPTGGREGRFRGPRQRELLEMPPLEGKQIIFVGLDMAPLEEARREDMRHTLLMALVLLLIGFAGVVFLFLAQAYRTTRTSLTRIKAFSDRVVEKMPVGLTVVDEDGSVLSLNRAAEEILEQSSGQAVGRSSADILPKEMVDLLSELNPDGQEVTDREIECKRPDGRPLDLDVSVSVLLDEAGMRKGRIVLFRDMTEVQALKREIETSRRLASLGRLAAGVAHEIRNPLSSIKGLATYFKERYKDHQEDKNTADIMINEVDRLNRAVTQLLELARPVALQKKQTSIRALIQHSLKTIEREASSRGILTRADLSSSPNEVLIDPDKMSQILLNLCINALEAMNQGGTLSVSCVEEAGGKRFKILIRDTGSGIEQKDLEHIFDPYFTTKQTGTGLGLAIVHNIVQAHGGEVKVESEPGEGTTVTVMMPL
ncbi:MAG: PAS domain-containing protein [Deltaproteobacteria bacterium]|nr:PAS domain-containing protein [Deltaproteobacteria bacterium]